MTTATETKPMCRGEMVARMWNALRENPDGLPFWTLRTQARQNGHSPTELLQRVLKQGKAEIEMRNGARWFVPGPRLNPELED